ncbi:MAG: CoA transferase subunit A [Lachnospiraceae bacterium]|nr:CoA transferase subunit A [Lachnospiraceae bacterium]
MAKQVSMQEAAALVKDGMTVMVGGFLSVGGANELLHAIAETGVKNLTLICNDGGQPALEHGVHEMIHNGQFKEMYATHIGINPEVGQMMNEGTMKVTLVPQGSMAEKIRAGGYGLGGVLTPTGIGTPVGEEAGKKLVEVNGKKFLLEEPLHADIAIIYGTQVDKYGNIRYHGTTRNFNVVMASAADTVVVQADEIVDMIDPDDVVVQGILVDYIVDGGAK